MTPVHYGLGVVPLWNSFFSYAYLVPRKACPCSSNGNITAKARESLGSHILYSYQGYTQEQNQRQTCSAMRLISLATSAPEFPMPTTTTLFPSKLPGCLYSQVWRQRPWNWVIPVKKGARFLKSHRQNWKTLVGTFHSWTWSSRYLILFFVLGPCATITEYSPLRKKAFNSSDYTAQTKTRAHFKKSSIKL